MKALIVSAAARRDLVSISEYTEREWGSDQRRRYLGSLAKRINALRSQHRLGRPREDVAPHLFGVLSGEHVIFYRITADAIVVVRVPHQRMDLRARLDEG